MYLTVFGQKYEVVNRHDRLLISGPYTRAWQSEFRELERNKSEGNGLYSCADTPRNRFTLDSLSGGQYNQSSKMKFQAAFESTGLWKHQEELTLAIVTWRRIIGAYEMRTGKTLATFRALQWFRDCWKDCNIWWVAPNSALTSLRTQSEKWKFRFNWGDKVINYHALEETMRSAKVPPRCVVFDESSYIKNATARRTQLAMALSCEMDKVFGTECSVVLLTGTPSPQSHFDWWAQCEVARPGWLKESTITKFKNRLADWEFGEGYPVFKGWKKHEVDLLPQRLKGLVLVKFKRECLDLPEKLYEEVVIPPDPSIKRVASFLARSGLSALQLLSKLRQLSDGFQYRDAGATDRIPCPKESYLIDDLSEHEEVHRLVVYCGFTESIDRVVEVCRKEKWAVWRFDGHANEAIGFTATNKEAHFNDRTKTENIVFVGHPEAAGMGLDLSASPTTIYYSNSFKGTARSQSEDRIHGPDMDKSRGCLIKDYLHLPCDKLVLDRVRSKRDAEKLTLTEIQEVMG